MTTQTQCPTKSGPYQCSAKLDANGKHAGPCEAQAREYTARTVFVTQHGWWYDQCPTHGLSEHTGKVRNEPGGCIECKKAKAIK